jgi:hypothetical protein
MKRCRHRRSARAKIRQELVDAGLVGGKTRMFAGKDQSGTSKVVLSDANAKPRLGAQRVDRAGSARTSIFSTTPERS